MKLLIKVKNTIRNLKTRKTGPAFGNRVGRGKIGK